MEDGSKNKKSRLEFEFSFFDCSAVASLDAEVGALDPVVHFCHDRGDGHDGCQARAEPAKQPARALARNEIAQQRNGRARARAAAPAQ
jgi:hypothetical protein